MRLDLQLCGRVLSCLHCEVWVTLVDAGNLRAHGVDSSDGVAESASFCRVGATKDEQYALGMIVGTVGLVCYSLAAAPLVKHLGPVAGSALAWAAWAIPALGLFGLFLA